MLETPWGLRDILPEEFEKRLYLKNKIRKHFTAWGYRELATPTFEYFSVLSIGVGEELKAQMLKFIDRDGHIMALRPEFTTSIGRIVATKLRNFTPPFRFFYLDNIFRYPKDIGTKKREIFQTGVELIGEEGIRGDVEIISLLATLLDEVGVKKYKIIVGSTPFFRAILKEFDIAKEIGEKLKHFLSIRDFVSFYNVLDELPREKRKNLRTIFSLIGDKDVLDELLALLTTFDAKNALSELISLSKIAEFYGVADKLEFDFSFLRDMDYYTGVVFELFVEGVGYSFAGGGRYDNLLPKMGTSHTATGFALELGGLLEVLSDDSFPKKNSPSLVVASPISEKYAIEFIQGKRAEGEPVWIKIASMSRNDCIEYAKKRNIKKLYIIDNNLNIETIWVEG